MYFSDLSPDAQHQFLVNLVSIKIAFIALSDAEAYLHLNTLIKDNKSPEKWAALLGALGAQEVLSMSEEEKLIALRQIDEAIRTQGNSTNKEGFVLIITRK